jgi:hypothetical protein
MSSWRDRHFAAWLGIKALAGALLLALIIFAISRANLGAAIVVAVCVPLLVVLSVTNRVILHREQMDYVRGTQWWADYQASKNIAGRKGQPPDRVGTLARSSDVDESVAVRSNALERTEFYRSLRLKTWTRWICWVSILGLALFLIGLATELWWVWVPGIALAWVLFPVSLIITRAARRSSRR